MIGLPPPIDWLLDRFRTATNAFGDAVGSDIVDTTFAPRLPQFPSRPNDTHEEIDNARALP